MPNDHLHFKLRIPEKLHLILKTEAAKHRRSITQEIVKRLQESFLSQENRSTSSLMEYAQTMERGSPARVLVENMARQTDLEIIAQLEAENKKLKIFIKEML